MIISERKEGSKIQRVKDEQKQNGRKPHATVKIPVKQNANTVDPTINSDDAQHMERKV